MNLGCPGVIFSLSHCVFLRKVFGRMKPDVSCIWRGCLERAFTKSSNLVVLIEFLMLVANYQER